MVKNEAKHLDRCLHSLVTVLETIDSELIIVDTGSTDNTVEIAKKYTKKVYHHEWTNNFSEMRNIVLSYTSGDWFFYLDGDEILEDAGGVIEFFNSGKYRKYNCAFIEMNNIFSKDNQDCYGSFKALRFFKNDKDFHFKGIVHEQPQIKEPIGQVDGTITHYGYINDDKELMEYKYQRNVELINKVLEEDPENIYHLFQLSQSYAMYKEYKKALEPIRKAYELAKIKGIDKYLYIINQLASIYNQNKMYREAEEKASEGLRLKDGYIDLYYIKATAQVELGKYEQAIVNFEKYLSLVDEYKQGYGLVDLSIAHRTVSFNENAYLTLCLLNNKLGYYEESLKYGNMIKDPKIVINVIPHLVDVYVKQTMISELKAQYEKWFDDEYIRIAIERAIESQRMTMDEAMRKELSLHFANERTPYGILHVARNDYYMQGSRISDEAWEKIKKFDLGKCESFFGDILFILIRYRYSVIKPLYTIRNERIAGFFMYLTNTYEEFKEVLIKYLRDNDYWNVEDQFILQAKRIKTAVLYVLLQQDDLADEDYEYFFQMYVEVGIEYMEASYHPNVLDGGEISWTKTSVDGFLLIMRLAARVDKNGVEYIRLLREALVQDGTMKRGIELLLNKVQNQFVVEPVNELKTLKDSVMCSIKEAINSGELETAVALVNEYEDIVGLDAQLASAKGIILMVNGRFDEARKLFSKGLELDPGNSDLAYNLDYLSKMQQN